MLSQVFKISMKTANINSWRATDFWMSLKIRTFYKVSVFLVDGDFFFFFCNSEKKLKLVGGVLFNWVK